jgi:hypothetical protein
MHRAIFVAAAALLLSACQSRQPAGKPITEVQKAAAFKAIDQARQTFNSGNCRFVGFYGGLVQVPRPADWSSQCQDLHERLGIWQSFNVTPCGRVHGVFACLFGSAEFAKGRVNILVQVLFSEAQPRCHRSA